MDLVVLRRLVTELHDRLAGKRVDQIYALPRYDLALVVAGDRSRRLWFSADPTEPHLYLRPGRHDSPDRPPAFAMAARKWGRGQRIERLAILGDDRVVELCFRSGARLTFELVPRRACAFVLEPDDTVAAVWTPRRGRPEPGDRWLAPERRPRPPVEEIGAELWRELADAPDERGLIGGLLRNVGGMTRLVAREVAARLGEQDASSLPELVDEELDRARRAPTRARVYAPDRPEGLVADPGSQRLVLAPYPLHQARELESFEQPDMTAAAAEFFGHRARIRRLEAVRDAVGGAIRSRLSTLDRSRRKVTERRSDPDDADRLRRLGDLLLAAPGTRIDGERVSVPDAYGDAEPIEIPVDPARSLHENAERYYRRARRAGRRVVRQRQRLEQLEAERERLEQLRARTGRLSRLEDCAGLLREASRADLELSEDKLRVAEAGPTGGGELGPGRGSETPDDGVAGVRSYRTADGREILVGRSAKGNDRLTHRIAGREDWWLHARGPGSHVVLRNPQREEEPPPETLRVAAALAAWFSKARGATKCEVDWTRVRELRRPRGGSPGAVLLGSHATLLATPTAPDELAIEETG